MARRKAQQSPSPTLAPPPMPPESSEEIATNEEIRRQLRDLAQIVRQRNLDRAVVLAQIAAAVVGRLLSTSPNWGGATHTWLTRRRSRR